MAINKIVYGNQTLIDLTSDTVSADTLLSGVTAHDKSGSVITGACTYDSDTQDANAAVADILATKTAYARGTKLTGTMPNIGANGGGSISTKAGTHTIARGYHDGTSIVGISSAEQAKIISTNIRQGVTILGVSGSMTGNEDVVAQSKTVTPTTSSQEITPDEAYTHLASVIVSAIPYAATNNAAGGQTVTIG